MTLKELEEIKKNYKVIEIAVDFINPSYNISRAKRLDTARYIVCTLTENGVPRAVKSSEIARIRLQKPDKQPVYNDCDILEDGRVFITLTEQILAVEGNAVCDIQVTNGDTGIIYSTKNFVINIDKTAVDNSDIESSYEFNALNKMIISNEKLKEWFETINIDDSLSLTSENPVQNKVITKKFEDYYNITEIDNKQGKFSVENIPNNSDLNNYKDLGFYSSYLFTSDQASGDSAVDISHNDYRVNVAINTNYSYVGYNHWGGFGNLVINNKPDDVKVCLLYFNFEDYNSICCFMYSETTESITWSNYGDHSLSMSDFTVQSLNSMGNDYSATRTRNYDFNMTIDNKNYNVWYYDIMGWDTGAANELHDLRNRDLINIGSKFDEIYFYRLNSNAISDDIILNTVKLCIKGEVPNTNDYLLLQNSKLVSTILNSPTKYPFFLTIGKSNNKAYQIVYSYDNKIYTRQEETNGWLNWKEINGGAEITVDSELSVTSENPVQNKVITEALNDIENIVYLTKDEYNTLITDGTVTTSSGKTYDYDDDTYYAFEGKSGEDIETIINDDVVSKESTFSSEKIQGMVFSATKAELIAEAITTYSGGFRLYSMGSLLIVENIPGLLVTGTTTQTLFTYDEKYPKVSSDQTYDIGDGIRLTLTTNRELKFQTVSQEGSAFTFTVTSGLELFMSDSLSEGGEIIERNAVMINAVHNYSTDEHMIGTWIDDKPLYERTVYIASLPSEANKETYYPHNIKNIDTICNFVGTAYFDNGNTAILNHLTTNAEYDSTGNISITVDKTSIRIAPRSDRSSMYAYVTIRYTKVNDNPITPQTTLENAINNTTFSSLSTQAKDLVGAINEVNKSHSYSTEEQVVGTWIDGKPVYQKTLVGIITEEITRLDIDSNYRILEVDGFIVRNRDGEAFNCRSQDGSYSIDIKVGIHHQILIILSTTMLIESWLTTDNNVYVTIQYTKTTD